VNAFNKYVQRRREVGGRPRRIEEFIGRDRSGQGLIDCGSRGLSGRIRATRPHLRIRPGDDLPSLDRFNPKRPRAFTGISG